MTSISAASLLMSSMASQTAHLEAGMAVMRKSNDVAKQEGEALVQLIENAAPPPDSGRLLDAYA